MSVSVAAPPRLEADRSPERRGLARDQVRLLLSDRHGERDLAFVDLPELLEPGDLLVVNESATIPASVAAVGPFGAFTLNLSTDYGGRLWLAEPRWGRGRPGPLPLRDGSRLDVAGLGATVVARHPTIPRLAFVRFDRDPAEVLERAGRPIAYGYLAADEPLEAYQTIFARVPGSVEMPSAGRPFSAAVLARLRARGVRLARIVLHCAVSSLEAGDDVTGAPPVLPEPYSVPPDAVRAIADARQDGRRVIAVGTTVVRALESSVDCGGLRASEGFSRRYVSPAHRPVVADGLISGFHAPGTTHRDLLAAFLGEERLRRAYRHACDAAYLWHEFGDVHLWLPR